MSILNLYRFLSREAQPFLGLLLTRRTKSGKEDPERVPERMGTASMARPSGPLVWIHAASVGESQSALILVDRLLQKDTGTQILMTTGTVSSASMMQKNLPAGAIHQFYPLDHPDWVDLFLDHWKPDLVLWMESELWPNMLGGIKARNIPAVLVNARLSQRSFKRWSLIKSAAKEILDTFSLILAQSETESARYRALGARNVKTTGNLKYSAKPLPFNEPDLKALTASIGSRPVWAFASTHKGEEAMACRIHLHLQKTFPGLLTIIIPRHPNRRDDIAETCQQHGVSYLLRHEGKHLPISSTAVYIADTFGELGLFYRLAPFACIGRSFSDDGGGGHNPIEAAQLNCAVLYGPHVQFQKELYEDMSNAGAALGVANETELESAVRELLANPEECKELQRAGFDFTAAKGRIIDAVITALEPYLNKPAQKMQARS